MQVLPSYLASIRPYLPDASTTQLFSLYQTIRLRCRYCPVSFHLFVSPKLDYYNSTLSGLPSASLNRLRKVQNNAARSVLHTHKSDPWHPFRTHNGRTEKSKIIAIVQNASHGWVDNVPADELSHSHLNSQNLHNTSLQFYLHHDSTQYTRSRRINY